MDNLLSLALMAKIPMIGVRTDDPVNLKSILQSIADPKKLQPIPTAQAASIGDAYTYLTEDMKPVTVDIYRKLCASQASLIIVNPEKSQLIFDAGVLEVPQKFYVNYLQEFIAADKIQGVLQVLSGLSLKGAQNVVQLCMARTGAAQPHEIRRTRMMLGGDSPGLYSLDTEVPFYVMPKPIQEWIDLNDKYFLDPATPSALMPRGLMLKGAPGVGKSLAAMVIAKHWDVPLFRLDIGSSLNRYLGVSEGRIAQNLQMVEANSPCIWLLDEVEKQFGLGGDEGTTERILSQVLWFLQYHKSKVITVMTSNDISKLPSELYRPGRVDRVIEIQKLNLSEAKTFAAGVYQNVVGKMMTMTRQKIVRAMLDKEEQGSMSHAEVSTMVYDLIKAKGWLEEEK